MQHPNQLTYSKRWRAKNAERWRAIRSNAQHRSKYGMTHAEREAMFEQQGRACPICGTKNPVTERKWHIDHCHRTQRVRGILCHSCNLLLGHAKDNINRLKKAIEYLERHNAARASI